MIDHSKMKLGCNKSPYDPRTLRFAKYVKALPPIPPARQWSAKVPMPCGMFKNDEIGDCTCAGAGHAIQVWSANAGQEVTIQDADVLAAYEAVSGYNPSDPNTDNGACLLDVLTYWRNTGIGGHKIGAFVSVNPKNLTHVQAACDLFGGLYTAAELPLTAQNQDVWDMTGWGTTGQGTPDGWGGHCLFVPDYDADSMTCITWGALKKMTQAWWLNYVDELYAIISTDFLNKIAQVTPEGFNLALLQQDLAQVSN